MLSEEQRTCWSAIREAPEEDTARLVYADWLDQHGQADRAEFIRVQCALAKLGPDRRKGRKERLRRSGLTPSTRASSCRAVRFRYVPGRPARSSSSTWRR
jgi:uncharacterized protein (TIGR02996 family)